MQNPRFSFSLAFVIWFLFLTIFSHSIFKKSAIPPAAIEIDAAMIGEFDSEKKSTAKNLEKENQTKNFLGKSLPEKAKKSEEKNQKSEKNLSNSDAEISQKKSIPLHQPLPKIPDDLRGEAFNNFAIARFHIAADGSVIQVELIKPCANPRLNHLLLKSLKNWKFSENKGGAASTQDIRVSFRVE